MGKVVRFPKDRILRESDDSYHARREEQLKQALKEAARESASLRLIIANKKYQRAKRDLRDSFWRMVWLLLITVLIAHIL